MTTEVPRKDRKQRREEKHLLKHPPLVSGKIVRFRREQMLAWSVIAGLLGACFIAGLYFGILEVNWHIFWLKPWWDAGSWWPFGHWTTYRHASFRDLLEPEVAIMAVWTLLARPKPLDEKPATWRLIVTPPALLALAIVLNVAGTWLLNFALPIGFSNALAKGSVGDLILGFALGHFVLRPFWMPVGRYLQGDRIYHEVGKARARGRVPLWEMLPVMPPVVRERFAKGWRDPKAPAVAGGRAHRWSIFTVTALLVLITILGGLAKYGFAHGLYLPFLNPRPLS